uniref:Bifunctional F420 biosynthesis protein FbiB n=1 Tax=Candidatus Methanophaga sp. ANME-1 ERB7 TaxID=2759913 RepID=A0A7G9ZAZ5_9EURY|nr:bifunctional F420 biosynthesis protein FbiB [Methanosarcinales archaeon ANME-1 ERB7]
MELLEAIKSRKSIRAFKPDQVPREVLTELLEVARWAPSGTNTQPWEFIVLTEKVLHELSHAFVEKVRSGDIMKLIQPDIEMFKSPAKGIYGRREQKFFKQFLDLLEPEEGKSKMQKWFELSANRYGAPALIIVVADKSAPGWFIFDIGSITQTIALAAQEFGLGTCILGGVAFFPDEVRRIANIPESKQVIIGIAIGYPDWAHPLNSLRTEREPVEKQVTWRGMGEEEEKNNEKRKGN